ncbi:MAG: serine hydrolase [Trueperaceae bacterium]|nr:serine hydrolase [Trueperaceae bacterium]
MNLAQRIVHASALLLALTGALAQGPASEPPRPAPDLAPRALEPEELDAVTIARIALRYDLDGVALDALAASGAPGLVLGVAVAGQTVFLEAYGSATVGGAPMPLDAPLWLASVSKPLTAVAVLRLAAEGRLDLDADAATLLPDGALGPPAHPDDGPVTVRHLLTHTAGLDVRSLGRTLADGEAAPSARDAVAAGLPPRVHAPGERLVYCNACYLALAAIVEGVTGQAQEEAYRELVFEPLGFAHATIAAEADAAYEAATVSGHAVGPGGVTPLAMPRLLESGAGRVRASASDLLALAEALTAPDAPPALSDGVRQQLLDPAVRLGTGLPGWTLGLAETAVLGHPAVRHDGDLPGVRAALLVVPDAQLAVFAYLNGTGADAGLEAASGRRDARDVLLEAVVARILGDARDADDPARGWPAATAATPEATPAPGLYRFDRVARTGPERMLAAAAPVVRIAASGDAVEVAPPPDLAAPATYRRADDGVLRRAGDGAPLASDGTDGRVLLHLGTTVGLERVRWLERPDVFVVSHAAAAVAALLVLLTWPIGALTRWRRREPVAWKLPAAVGRARGFARVGAAAALAILAILVALTLQVLATSDAPLAAGAPVLQALAAVLALALAGLALATAVGAVRHPRLGLRWAWHALAAVAFAALLTQGWVWGLWSPEALQATWTDLVGGPAVAVARTP